MREVSWLNGHKLSAVDDPEGHGQWLFRFGEGHLLNIECPWRLTDGTSVILGRCDHGQQFGLPAPVNAVADLLERIGGRAVARTLVSKHGDLQLEFTGGLLFETFTESAGYESWTLSIPGEPPIIGRGIDGAAE